MEESAVPQRVNRELSWLAFNGRVLQEAADPAVPLFERLDFLAIYASNLDEFFRVRVASLRSLLRLKRKKLGKLRENPVRLLREIHSVVSSQQETFGEIFRGQLVPALERHGIYLVGESRVDDRQAEFLTSHFREVVHPHLRPVYLEAGGEAPFLENRRTYLVVELWPDEPIALSSEKPHYALVEIPCPPLDRFVELPATEEEPHPVMFLDDVIRSSLPELFPGWDVGQAYAVKLTRDAELYIEDEFTGDFVEAMQKALAKRDEGPPSRFLYDLQASYALVSWVKERLGLADEDLVVGGRYHNLHDLAQLPRFGIEGLSWDEWAPLPHPELSEATSILDTVARGDRLLHFPYQSYQSVVRFMDEAAADPDVEEIWLTVYRVTEDSAILGALQRAAERGKTVRVFVEVKARFDEESNIRWAERLERAGVVTYSSGPELKVHAKLALVVRREGETRRRYAYLATGNFNERTARQYVDLGLLTVDERLTGEVATVFRYLAGEEEDPTFEHLLVAPINMREELYRLVETESLAAREGRECGIVAKMNGLEDEQVIQHIWEGETDGVPIDLVVRGICCLRPRPDGNLRIRSILDRYLEHWRAWLFHAGGEERIYLSSADWMYRNLSRRVEVAFPLYDENVRREVREALDIQLRDNVKARVVDGSFRNRYVTREQGEPVVRAQEEARAAAEALLEVLPVP
ncbi:MAG: polyphosphate kinase 1 [Gemmatimonadota bacterium]|jgi:polyphosphate kinase